MGVMKLILLGRRQFNLRNVTSSSQLSRLFSSDSNADQVALNKPPQVQPVSYTPKPAEALSKPDGEAEPETPARQPARLPFSRPRMVSSETWSREDARYLKDSPSITPVSYPTRVAPLPEESTVSGAVENADVARENVVMDRKRMVDVASLREEVAVVPFPRLLMPTTRDKKPIVDLMEAIRQVKANARKTFDETLEAHAKLGIEKSRSDMIVRGTLMLPHGGKKVIKVAVFAEGADADDARAAGADVVGGTELIDEIASTGKVDFDKCFTTRKMYPRVAKLARILNRHGLMPDAKQGTVVSDIAKAVTEAKKNQIKFRMDKSAIVHVGLGKLSFSEEALRENVGAFMDAILQAKPAGLKKTSKYAGYVTSFHICSTMGQGFPITLQSLTKAVDHYHTLHLNE